MTANKTSTRAKRKPAKSVVKAVPDLTNFQKVTHFNRVLGQGVAEKPGLTSLPQCQLRLQMIHEEALVEMNKAMDERDLVALADAIGDALVVVYGAANDAGLDADKCFEIVHHSNMSKLALSEDDAKKACELYAAGNGYQGKEQPIQASYRPAPGEEGKFIVFDAQSGKTLKAPTFQDPAEALEKMIFPKGRPADPYAKVRKDAREKAERGEMSQQELWQFEASLDSMVA